MANPTSLHHGGIIQATTTVAVFTLANVSGETRGTLLNTGLVRVYVGYQKNTVVTDDSLADGYGWVDPNLTIKLPKNITKFCIKTASSTASLVYVNN